MTPTERLSDRQYVTLVLRLLIDQQGRVVSGEVGDLEQGQSIERWVRFRGADGLLASVLRCLSGAQQDAEHPG